MTKYPWGDDYLGFWTWFHDTEIKIGLKISKTKIKKDLYSLPDTTNDLLASLKDASYSEQDLLYFFATEYLLRRRTPMRQSTRKKIEHLQKAMKIKDFDSVVTLLISSFLRQQHDRDEAIFSREATK